MPGTNRPTNASPISVSRRGFLQGVGCSAAAVGCGFTALAGEAAADLAPPPPKPLRVKPILTYSIRPRKDRDSFRGFGALDDMTKVKEEVARIEAELKKLAAQGEFPVEFLPVDAVNDGESAAKAAAADSDVLLVYPAGGYQSVYKIVESKTPKVLFIRHKSGPYYLWHEAVHWQLLRGKGDQPASQDLDAGDIVVDRYEEVLWRLRGLFGLKNAKGTKMLAVGGLAAYTPMGQECGPPHAKDVWNYSIENISVAEFAARLAQARADRRIVDFVERQTQALLDDPNVKLSTERRYVWNSLLGLHVAKLLMRETGASNIGFAYCMKREFIEMLDTPPCLLLALANDEGYTAFCHTDLTHTLPGVLLHWISGKPSFLCNTHFPHDGVFTVAHCAAPRKMNGKTAEPTTLLTHFESDYGAATKIEYPKGQIVTAIISNFHCTRWHGFRGRVIDSPSLPACRSQMDIQVDGDWRRLLAEQEGFHAQLCYGDYLHEVGYALKKLKKLEWRNYSVS